MEVLLALLLLPGGVIGGAVASIAIFRSDDAWIFNVHNSAFALIFLSSAWQGLQLLRGQAYSRTWVGVILAAQVMRLAAIGIDFEFCTGLCAGLLINDPAGKHFGLGIGPAIGIAKAAPGVGTAVLNVVAVAALVGLLWPWRGMRIGRSKSLIPWR